MKIGILTSSRADYGIYLPLLKALKQDPFFEIEIIAFGTHLSNFHGYTLNQIKEDGFEVQYQIENMMLSDSSEAIAAAMGITMLKFSSFWKEHQTDFDLVFCLGDRFEMFAAVLSAIPFQIKFAHLHGGEKTLGAIDNVFRHSISLSSVIHFTSTEEYKNRILELLDVPENIVNVGSLSLDNILDLKLLDKREFETKWGINLELPTCLVTFHPETVNAGKNAAYAKEIAKTIQHNSNLQFLITMPNADTAGNTIRTIFNQELKNIDRVFMVENLGTLSYFSAMKNVTLLLGNTSSGIIEAASLGKYVINLGVRQEVRLCSNNVIHTAISFDEINAAIDNILKSPVYEGENIYHNGLAAQKIISFLKQYYSK